MDFKNKIVVVTGGGQGIGRAIYLKFVLDNGKVIIIERICIFTKGARSHKTKVSQF
jgi:NAD(P)-dependent dehydrogenase (short-subunit alcohol dehydrogenase family)